MEVVESNIGLSNTAFGSDISDEPVGEETSSRKRARPEDSAVDFGEEIPETVEPVAKHAKLHEDDLPNDGVHEAEKGEEKSAVRSIGVSALDDIFDAGDEDDYDHSADRAHRLQYLTSTGTKIRKSSQPDEKSSFSEVMAPRSGSRKSHASAGFSSISSQYKPVNKNGPRTKMEQQEFVKDSVQSKLLRDTAPSIKPKLGKTLDFNNFVQTIADRQTQIKLPTAEQVGLNSLLDGAEEVPEMIEDHVSNESEEDEISIEVDEEEENLEEAAAATSKPMMPPPAPKIQPHKAAPRSKSTLLDDEEGTQASEARQISAPPKQPSNVPKQLVSLDDFDLEDDDNESQVAPIHPPQITQTIDRELQRPASQISVEESSQTSVTDSSLQLEYPATIAPEEPKTTPGGMKLKAPSISSSKSSLMSSWLTGKSNTPSSTNSTKVVPSKTANASKSSTVPTKGSSLLLSGELFDENANSGAETSSSAQLHKRLVKGAQARQLFDDEAEIGFGSDAEEVAPHERAQASSDEEEGGASQDEYEVEVEDADSERKSVEGDDAKSRFSSDIFEADDRAVIRSVQMQQEMDREEAEMRAMEEMALRKDRRARRVALELHAEANMLMEDRKMEARLEARRAKRRGVEDSTDTLRNSEHAVSASSASMPVSLGEKEWFMDDSDEEGEVKKEEEVNTTTTRKEMEKRRVEAIEEQQQRRRLASSAHFLLQDEDSQSILQVIERANTQHSQNSGGGNSYPASGTGGSMAVVMMDENSMFFGAGAGEESQDSNSLGGWFDRTSMSFSASSKEHLSKLKSHYKGNSTQLTSSSLLFQRSQDGFGENSQDGHVTPASVPLKSSIGSSGSGNSNGAGNSKKTGSKNAASATASTAPTAGGLKRSKSSTGSKK